MVTITLKHPIVTLLSKFAELEGASNIDEWIREYIELAVKKYTLANLDHLKDKSDLLDVEKLKNAYGLKEEA